MKKSELYTVSPWADHENNIWLATSMTLLRNLEKFSFPEKLPQETRQQIVKLLATPLLQHKQLQKPKLLLAEEASPQEKEFLAEQFLLPQHVQQAHTGEAFLFDQTGAFLALMNLKEHLSLHVLDVSGTLEKSFGKLVELEGALEANCSFAFSPQFGYLTSDAANCGTALTVEIFLQLPALLHLGQVETKQDGILLRSLSGDKETFIGDVVVVSNHYTLGVTAESTLQLVRAEKDALIKQEEKARSFLKESQDASLMDKVSRAFAVSTHSYQMDAQEALSALSLLKLGVDLGWVSGVSLKRLNALMLMTRRAHLQAKQEKQVELEKLSQTRAEFLHQSLKGIQLLLT